MRRCKICREKEATVPDRNKPWSDKPEVCSDCHSNRLRQDLAYVLEVEKRKTKS